MKVCLIEPPKFVSLTNCLSTVSMPQLGWHILLPRSEKEVMKYVLLMVQVQHRETITCLMIRSG